MFLPLDIFLEYWIEHVSFGPLYVMFTFPTRIFYGEFRALQLIVFAAFGVVDLPLAPCMLVHVLEI